MDSRQEKILKAILDAFIKTGIPIGSMTIYESRQFDVSPATIRNEMAALEKEGFITQPHTSAGRIPTNLAYRKFVDNMQVTDRLMTRARQDVQRLQKEYYLKATQEKLFDMVSILASATQNVSFATLPERDRVFYIGVSNMLRQPEFLSDPAQASQVVETLEHRLHEVLSKLSISGDGAVYIGEENLIPEFQSCSLLALPYAYKGFRGVMGILGPTRMDYAYNMATLKSAVQML